jgi:AcrR family transcriptional regulator
MAKAKAAMARLGASERIRLAALGLFKARGYHGTSVRELAEALGIEPASLYHHFPSKQAILVDLFDRAMDVMQKDLHRAIAAGATPAAQLRNVVYFHVLFHIEHQDEAFVSHSELRSLTAPNHRRIIGKRDRYEKAIRDLLAAGVRAGEFEIADIRLTSIAILMMCSGVSDWFARRGRLKPENVAESYAEMVLRLVSAR